MVELASKNVVYQGNEVERNPMRTRKLYYFSVICIALAILLELSAYGRFDEYEFESKTTQNPTDAEKQQVRAWSEHKTRLFWLCTLTGLGLAAASLVGLIMSVRSLEPARKFFPIVLFTIYFLMLYGSPTIR